MLDKFVGGSEEKIRALFADAEKEQLEMGDNSMLHIIIFDEMDAIMKTRGSTGDSTGVNDSVVNQLLSKIDGVDALNNILIIGKILAEYPLRLFACPFLQLYFSKLLSSMISFNCLKVALSQHCFFHFIFPSHPSIRHDES